ncbi:MAG: hypothetical protein OSB62_08760 [Alphaproteobacteria bacterium]|nr:hypothetical protein [Alphaproteobacteria bacterium]
MMRLMLTKTLILSAFVLASFSSFADVIKWYGPTQTMTLGLSDVDISHVEFPEEITNITIENSDYVDVLVVEGYANRAFRMRSLLPKMATRAFLTGGSGNTYIVILTTDVPYRSFVRIEDGNRLNEISRKVSKKFNTTDLLRAMSEDSELPGVTRETHVIPNWFKGAGLSFELSEVWQTATLTGLVVHVKNDYPVPNEVNLPAISLPKTSEWGTLRKAAMENMRLSAKGKANDTGILYLMFAR